jgi:hypothetical protein
VSNVDVVTTIIIYGFSNIIDDKHCGEVKICAEEAHAQNQAKRKTLLAKQAKWDKAYHNTFSLCHRSSYVNKIGARFSHSIDKDRTPISGNLRRDNAIIIIV